jgi:hypothetical protein
LGGDGVINVFRLLKGRKPRKRVNGVAIRDEGNVTILRQVTRLDLPVERVLHGALDNGLSDAVVIGWDKNGDFYFAATYADGANVLWLLELAKTKLIKAGA